MKIRKIFGNPLGEIFVLIAEIVGLAGSIYLGLQCLMVRGFDKLGDFFANSPFEATMGMLAAFIGIPLLLVAFIGTIVGLAKRSRSTGVMSVFFLIAGLLVPMALYFIVFVDLASFSVDFSKLFTSYDTLFIIGIFFVFGGLIFDIIAVICMAARKRPGAVVFAILGLICFVVGAVAGVISILNQSGAPFVLLSLFAGEKVSAEWLVCLLLSLNAIFWGLLGLAIFFLSFARVKEKAAKPVASTSSASAAPVADEKHHKKNEPVVVENDHAKVYNDRNRIIIEIR